MTPNPQTPKKKYNLRKRKKNQTKKQIESDSDSDSDSDYMPGISDEEEEDFNVREWQRFLGKMFPSKHTQRRNTLLNAMDKLKGTEEQNII